MSAFRDGPHNIHGNSFNRPTDNWYRDQGGMWPSASCSFLARNTRFTDLCHIFVHCGPIKPLKNAVLSFAFLQMPCKGKAMAQLQHCLAAWFWQDQFLYLKAFLTNSIPGNPTVVYQPTPVKETPMHNIVIVNQAPLNG